MRLSPLVLCGIAVLVVLSGCPGPFGDSGLPTEESDDPVGGAQLSLADLVRSIPEFVVDLPRSLAESPEPQATAGSSIGARSVSGEVVDPAELPRVRSNAWGILRTYLGMDVTFGLFMAILKDTIPDDAESGTVVTVGTRRLGDYSTELPPDWEDHEQDFGTYQVFLEAAGGDQTEITVNWYAEQEFGEGSNEIRCRIFEKRGADGSEFTFVLHGTAEMAFFVYRNESTGESLAVVDNPVYDSPYASRSSTNDDGSVSFMMDNGTTTALAWGNNEVGAILTVGSDAANVAYYGEGGTLFAERSGLSDSVTASAYLPPTRSTCNLASVDGIDTPPEQFFVLVDQDSLRYRLLPDDEPAELTGCGFSQGWPTIVFRADESVWQAGDVIYHWSEVTEDGIRVAVGVRVLESDTFLGASYHTLDHFPLQRLLPLAAAYSDDYQLQRGDTGDEGEPVYVYFLDKRTDGTIDTLDPLDLALHSVHMREMSFWDPETGTTSRIEAPVMTTTGEVPAFFSHNDLTTISAAESGLSVVSDEYLAYRFVDDLARLDTLEEDYLDEVDFTELQ